MERMSNRQRMALLLAVMNEPSKETMEKVMKEMGTALGRAFLDNKDGASQREAERILYESVLPYFIREVLYECLEDAWYINHPKRELTEEERKETARLYNELLCSNMADCPQWGQEAKYRAKIEKRLDEIYGTYDRSYKIERKFNFHTGISIKE